MLDCDRDGDLDCVTADATDDFERCENRVADREGGHWLRVRVRGTAEQTPVGAEVYATTENGTQFAVTNSGTNFFSRDARPVHSGPGDAEVRRVRVVWPDETEHAVADVPSDATIVVGYDGSLETRER